MIEITSQQIKAARALLDWKQSDLAKLSGISLPSINNIERNLGSPRVDTMLALKSTFENGGIEFLSGQGVRLREDIFDVSKHEGNDFIQKQNDDLFACMKTQDDEVLMCGLDERKFPQFAPDQVARYDAYQKKINFKERILVKTNDTFFLADPKAYRWVSPSLIGTIPYLVYKDRFVMIMWERKRIIIIRNQEIADTFKKQFDFLWNLGKPVPAGSKSKLR